MMTCEYHYTDTERCPRKARARFKLNGAMSSHYVCTIHLNRELRRIVAFDSPRMMEIGFCA